MQGSALRQPFEVGGPIGLADAVSVGGASGSEVAQHPGQRPGYVLEGVSLLKAGDFLLSRFVSG